MPPPSVCNSQVWASAVGRASAFDIVKVSRRPSNHQPLHNGKAPGSRMARRLVFVDVLPVGYGIVVRLLS